MPRLTPMQEHQMRTNAAQASSAAALDEQQRALRWLYHQRTLLGGIQSRQAREAHKAQVMPEIAPYLQGVMQANTGQPDPVLSYAAVWAIDAGMWALACELGRYVIGHGLAMPDEFERNAATTLADLMADAALIGRMSAADARQWLPIVMQITAEADMPDQTRAKNHKAIAYGLAGKTTLAGQPGDWSVLDAATLRLALDHLLQAEQLDANAGVKKDIAAVQKLLQKQEQPADSSAPAKPAAKAATKAKGKTKSS